MKPGTICAWCHPGQTGNHGICEEHQYRMLAEARSDGALDAFAQRLHLPVDEAIVDQEALAAQDRVRRRWWHWLRTEPVPDIDLMAGGKRWDQLIFSAVVLVVALGLGLIVGVLVCAWGFWHGGAM